MKRKMYRISVAIILFSVGMNGCVVLKSVNNFSATSLDGIQKFEEINYTFHQHCLERCQFELIKEFEIKRDTVCNCDIYIKADNATLLIYNSIKGYLAGLTNLSGNKITDYRINNLEKSIPDGDYGDIKIEKKQVAAYSRILEILSKATTDAYRRKKIEKYVGEGNEPVQILIEKFQFIIHRNLEAELDYKKERLYDYFRDMKMNNTLSDYEKGKATIDYYQQLSDINAKQKQMDAFARSLSGISEGHQKLYDRRNNMSARELRELLTGYAGDIRDLISEFNKLKK
jgi:hypothetical protein